MFNQKIGCEIKSITANVKEVNKGIRRFCSVALLCDFTPEFAAGISGGDGEIHDRLCVGPLKKATLEINEGVAVTLNPGESDQLEFLATAESAQLSAPVRPEDHPLAKLTISFNTEDDRLLWFAHRLCEGITVRFTPRQTELEV